MAWDTDINPVYVLMAIFLLIVFTTLFGFVSGIISVSIPNPFSANTVSNTIAQIGINTAQATYGSAFSVINEGLVVVFIGALFANALIAYYNPNKANGYLFVLMVFLIPVLWLVFKIALLPISNIFNIASSMSLNLNSTAFNFFISTYTIVITDFMCAICAILNFRHSTDISDQDRFDGAGYSDIRTTVS